MSTDYATTAQLASELGIHDSDDNTELALAISAASRQIDGWLGRRIYQDTSVATREFYAASSICVDLLEQPDEGPSTEISTTTGLIVKIDDDGDGTFETTLTISTDFLLMPRNAAADNRGFSEILLVDNYNFPRPSNGRAGVQVTAKFGWPAVPDDVEKACLVQAAQLFKSKDAVFGAVALGDSQAMFMRASLNASAKALLAPFQKPAIG